MISVLMLYPDNEFIDSLPLLETEITQSINGPVKDRLLGFVKAVKTIPAIHLQEHYTEVFDMNPGTCLNLTYHSIGDTEKRGRVLAQLNQLYLQAGYENITSELPDFLPLILEFLAQCPQADGIDLLWHHLEAVGIIAHALEEIQSPYQLLMGILLENHSYASL